MVRRGGVKPRPCLFRPVVVVSVAVSVAPLFCWPTTLWSFFVCRCEVLEDRRACFFGRSPATRDTHSSHPVTSPVSIERYIVRRARLAQGGNFNAFACRILGPWRMFEPHVIWLGVLVQVIHSTFFCPFVSRLFILFQDILDSEIGWLGWMDSESYGLTWKVSCMSLFVCTQLLLFPLWRTLRPLDAFENSCDTLLCIIIF